MKRILAAALATTALVTPVLADETPITEFRIGILGGENAQDRLNSYQCLADYTTEELGVETKLFAPADYNGVIQGLLGGTLDIRLRCHVPARPRSGRACAGQDQP